jgi:gluconokinase
LKARYRDTLRGDCRGIRFVYLKVPEPVATARVAARVGHFAPAALVPGQFDALDEPSAIAEPTVITVDATLPIDRIVDAIRYEFGV